MTRLASNLPTIKNEVGFPKITELGDYFVITPNRHKSVGQGAFDEFQNKLSDFISMAEYNGYEARSGMVEEGVPPLSVVFRKKKPQKRIGNKERLQIINVEISDSDDS